MSEGCDRACCHSLGPAKHDIGFPAHVRPVGVMVPDPEPYGVELGITEAEV